MSESLYFIAIVPPQELQDEITEIKHLVVEKFGSKHALNAPPHITLHMPFKWKDKKLDKLKDTMRAIDAELTPFQIGLKDFDFFEPRVVFVDVMKNEKLDLLQGEVVKKCRQMLHLDSGNYKDRPFHPHVTVAFRDLKKPAFYEAKSYFEKKTFNAEFEVEQVSLLKLDGKRWYVADFD